MVTRIITGAHYGLKDWLVQRVTAVIMAIYAVLFAGMVMVCSPSGFEDWQALFAPQWMRLASLLFFLSLFWHAWIGMRDILPQRLTVHLRRPSTSALRADAQGASREIQCRRRHRDRGARAALTQAARRYMIHGVQAAGASP